VASRISSALPADPGAYGPPPGRSAWMAIDWREHQRWVSVAGVRLNVIDLGVHGDELPIVFVHGLSGSWQNWLEQLPHFARSRRVVAFDLPGFGFSEMPAEKISIPGYGRVVDALLEALGVGSAVIVGNSMGGFIGAEVAIQYPARVERLVLVSAAGLTAEHQRSDRALAALHRSERALRLWGTFLGSRAQWLTSRPRARLLMVGFVAHRPDRLPAPLIAEQIRGSGKPGFVDALDALSAYPIRDRLGEIACPTLVVWGRRDHLVPVRDADVFERLIPDARKVVWDDTGHVAMLERPLAFNRLLDAFLAEEPGEEVEASSAAGAPDAPAPAASA
jgi:4,5:9,10-diseco-3-hydroxy-5,9,17-trioxoandrosta-1(10),2-diene-4-oate hydrolase